MTVHVFVAVSLDRIDALACQIRKAGGVAVGYALDAPIDQDLAWISRCDVVWLEHGSQDEAVSAARVRADALAAGIPVMIDEFGWMLLRIQSGEILRHGAPLSQIARECHQLAVSKGWHDGKQDSDTVLVSEMAMIMSEGGEAVDAVRSGLPAEVISANKKPEGWAVELCDGVIRSFDSMVLRGVDVAGVLLRKHEYNKTRPFRHGGKKL